ncbi:hypothetical protein ACP70R_007699 [Stipagrostis hirtigluma subsp. patula]
MTTTKPAAAVAAVVVLVLLLVAVGTATTTEAAAAACSPARLTPCAGPLLFGGAAVPAGCCAALRAEQGCLCGYARSPNYGTYVRSPNAARLFAACRIPIPRCRR